MEIKHGGNVQEIAEKYQLPQGQLLDFSANINPLGLSPTLKEVLQAEINGLVHYPDLRYAALRQAIATFHQVPVTMVYPGNGAAEVIFNLAQVLKLQRLMLLAPTFMEYEGAFRNYGTSFHYYNLEAVGFHWQLSDFLAAAAAAAIDGICLCNPNNPTGQLLCKAELLALLAFCQERQLTLIVDEAFIDFVEAHHEYSLVDQLTAYDKLFIIRSLTKMFAIPGLRLGYLLTSSQETLQAMEAITVPWHINSFASAVGQAALREADWLRQTQQYVTAQRRSLRKKLAQFANCLTVYPSHTNYLFFHYNGPDCLQERLLTKGILLRKCDSFRGLSGGYYRIAVRTSSENAALIQAMEEVL